MNYTELTNAILAFTENDEATFAANIDNFIKMAEKRIYATLKLPAQRKNVVGTMTASTRYLTIPSDALRVLSVQYTDSGSRVVLEKKDTTFLVEAYPDNSSTAAPQFYAVYDADTLLLAPTPDDGYSVELQYDGYPDSIVSVGSNWLGDNLDRLLLYGALVEADTFMKGDDDMTSRYEGAFREELEKASIKVQSGAYGLDEYRAGA